MRWVEDFKGGDGQRGEGSRGRYGSALDRAERFRLRVKVLYGVFAILFSLVLYQAVYLMAVPPEQLEAQVMDQHRRTLKASVERGRIVDRHGESLALSVAAYGLAVDPWVLRRRPSVDDPNGGQQAVWDAARALAPLVGHSETKVRQMLSRQDTRYVLLARRVSEDVVRQVRALDIDGVILDPARRRAYPHREMGASLLGFVNADGEGREGLERIYDEVLRGEEFSFFGWRDGHGREVSADAVILRRTSQGGHLVLTLDTDIQYVAEAALARGIARAQALRGFALVMDPKTGEILASAQQPSFNPNRYGKYPQASFPTLAAVTAFEPGSTIKPLVVAAALEEGEISSSERIDCEQGRYKLGRHRITDTHPHGRLTPGEILKVSSNIGAAKLGERLGDARLYKWLRAYGFGQSTGSGIPAEGRGILRPLAKWSGVQAATQSYGYGISVSGIQLLSAFNTLANDGQRVAPSLIKEVIDSAGRLLDSGVSPTGERLLSAQVAATVREMLVAVTDDDGTAPLARVPGYSVAGKTGTARKVDPRTRRYGKGMYVASFMGMVPAEDPRITILVVLDQPQGKHYYGGMTAGPIFAEIAQRAMKVLAVPPTRALREPSGEVRAIARAAGVTLLSEPDAPSLDGRLTLPSEDLPTWVPVTVEEDSETLDPEAEAQLASLASEWTVPDLTGYTLRTAISTAAEVGVLVEVSGHGRVVAQVPQGGEVLSAGQTMRLVLAPETIAVATGRGR